jgi:hypothetical protein
LCHFTLYLPYFNVPRYRDRIHVPNEWSFCVINYRPNHKRKKYTKIETLLNLCVYSHNWLKCIAKKVRQFGKNMVFRSNRPRGLCSHCTWMDMLLECLKISGSLLGRRSIFGSLMCTSIRRLKTTHRSAGSNTYRGQKHCTSRQTTSKLIHHEMLQLEKHTCIFYSFIIQSPWNKFLIVTRSLPVARHLFPNSPKVLFNIKFGIADLHQKLLKNLIDSILVQNNLYFIWN